MRVTVNPSAISGRVKANPSKSYAQRALAISALAKGATQLTEIGTSADVKSALGIVQAMGTQVAFSQDNHIVEIQGQGTLQSSEWDCGESGLCLRMFSAIAGLFDKEITLNARGSLSGRPVHFMENTFEQLGVEFSNKEGFPPVHVKGRFQPGNAIFDGSVSSQFLTGLLIALPLIEGDSILEVNALKSKPYVDMTLDVMKGFGVHIQHDEYRTFQIAGDQQYTECEMQIPGDWSGMAFLLVGAAIKNEISVTGLPKPGTQADGKILDVLLQCGANVHEKDDSVSVKRGDLKAFEHDCTHCPDLVPPLVALAVHCNGTSRIDGIHRLKVKESDRGETLITEFRKLGADISLEQDVLVVKGGPITGGTVDAHGDHRIAMALAIAALGAVAPVTITGAQCVEKSYPRFFHDLASLGTEIQYS